MALPQGSGLPTDGRQPPGGGVQGPPQRRGRRWAPPPPRFAGGEGLRGRTLGAGRGRVECATGAVSPCPSAPVTPVQLGGSLAGKDSSEDSSMGSRPGGERGGERPGMALQGWRPAPHVASPGEPRRRAPGGCGTGLRESKQPVKPAVEPRWRVPARTSLLCQPTRRVGRAPATPGCMRLDGLPPRRAATPGLPDPNRPSPWGSPSVSEGRRGSGAPTRRNLRAAVART
jgi:hypothetical protein